MCDGSVACDYFRNISAGLTRNGVDVLLVELGSGIPPRWVADLPNVRYLSLNASGRLQYPPAAKRLGEILRTEKIDILHTHLFYSGLIGVYAKKHSPETRIAIMRHHTSVVRMQGNRLYVAIDRWMAKKADHVMTVSNAAAAYMRDVDGIRREDIDVVHLGFDFEKFSRTEEDRHRFRAEFGIADDAIVIGYVANFAKGKGHIQLIEAFERFAAKVPNARLLFAGRGDDRAVRAAAKGSERVIFAGWRDDVPACLSAMDIFVQPSLSEAFSQVLIEAMAARLPVIATDVGGAREVIESGVNGIIIKPNDPAAIERELVRLHEDNDLRREISERGARDVRKRFSADIMVERHLELYTKWVSER